MLRKGTGSCQDVKVSTREIEGGSIDVPGDVFRGMLAEAALHQIGRAATLAPAASPESYTRGLVRLVTGRDPAVDAMAVCTAEVNPAAVRDMLKTQPDSAEEFAAAQSLGATLGPCLPQGATLKANRQSLRAALAEAVSTIAINTPALGDQQMMQAGPSLQPAHRRPPHRRRRCLLPLVGMAAVISVVPAEAQDLGTRIKRYDPAEISVVGPKPM